MHYTASFSSTFVSDLILNINLHRSQTLMKFSSVKNCRSYTRFTNDGVQIITPVPCYLFVWPATRSMQDDTPWPMSQTSVSFRILHNYRLALTIVRVTVPDPKGGVEDADRSGQVELWWLKPRRWADTAYLTEVDLGTPIEGPAGTRKVEAQL